MFQKMLNLLNGGKTYSQYELARELDISPDTLQAWIAYLASCGLLTKVNLHKGADCHINGCGSCSGCQACSSKHTSENLWNIWELNQKDIIV
ncbi:MAG TPA: hypothetical protein GX736_01640 [Mogibacterium sp.]|nr:hypothetical protein [Mogibacterium sp.]